MVIRNKPSLVADVLVLPTAEFSGFCATPDEYVQPDGLSSLDFYGELFIDNYGGKLELVVSSQRDFSVMRHHDKSLRTGTWRVEQATRLADNRWRAKVDNVTFTFDSQTCAIHSTDGFETLTVSFATGVKTNVCTAHFILE
jgi:hypothetical protein